MSKKDELSAKMDYITDVFVLAQDMFLYVDYLCYPETKEEKDLVNKSIHAGHIDRISHYIFRSMVSEIAKLYSKSDKDKFSLYKLVRSLGKDGEYRSLNFPEEFIQKWIEELNSNEDLIKRICVLRDKVYAHTDSDKKKWIKNVTLTEIKELVDFTAIIIKEIYSVVFDTYVDLESNQFDRERFIILKQLATSENARLEKIHNETRASLNKIDKYFSD